MMELPFVRVGRFQRYWLGSNFKSNTTRTRLLKPASYFSGVEEYEGNQITFGIPHELRPPAQRRPGPSPFLPRAYYRETMNNSICLSAAFLYIVPGSYIKRDESWILGFPEKGERGRGVGVVGREREMKGPPLKTLHVGHRQREAARGAREAGQGTNLRWVP